MYRSTLGAWTNTVPAAGRAWSHSGRMRLSDGKILGPQKKKKKKKRRWWWLPPHLRVEVVKRGLSILGELVMTWVSLNV